MRSRCRRRGVMSAGRLRLGVGGLSLAMGGLRLAMGRLRLGLGGIRLGKENGSWGQSREGRRFTCMPFYHFVVV